MPNRLLILDLSNLAARAYHVVKRGREDESVYGLAKHQLKVAARSLVRQVDPLRICGALDGERNFRQDLYPNYKGHRGEKDPELSELMRSAGDILAEEIGAEIYSSDNYEADDVIATLAQASIPYGWRICIASNDADLQQLVCDLGGGTGVFVMRSEQGAYTSVGPAEVEAGKMGVPPLRVPLAKAMMGDASDGYEGVPGLGPVAARRIATTYRSPKQIFDNLDRLQKSDRTKLTAAGREHLELMLNLATLRSDAPLTRCA